MNMYVAVIGLVGLALILGVYYASVNAIVDSVNVASWKLGRPDISFGYTYYAHTIIVGIVNHDSVNHTLLVTGTCIVNESVGGGVFFSREYKVEIPYKLSASSYNYTVIDAYKFFNIPRQYNATIVDLALTLVDNESGYTWLGSTRLPETIVVVVGKKDLGRTYSVGEYSWKPLEATLIYWEDPDTNASSLYARTYEPEETVTFTQANTSLSLEPVPNTTTVNYTFTEPGRITVFQGIILEFETTTPLHLVATIVGDMRGAEEDSSKNIVLDKCGLLVTSMPWLSSNPLLEATALTLPYNSTTLYSKTIVFAGKYCTGVSVGEGYLAVKYSNIYPVVLVFRREP